MSLSRFAAPALALLVAIAVLVMANYARLQHVAAVTNAGDETLKYDAKSRTGYAGDMRALIVPGHNAVSYQWIAQAQQGAYDHAVHVRHVDYDNAPLGRDVLSPSPYRWWLALLGRVRDLFSGAPLAANIEQASVFANPILAAMSLAVLAAVLAMEFGGLVAALGVIAVAFFYPFNAALLGGEPNDLGLTQIATVAALLAAVIAVGRYDAGHTGLRASRPFVIAGVLTGGVVWFNAAVGIATALTIALGGIVAEIIAPRDRNQPRASAGRGWVIWGTAAGATTLGAVLVEYMPGHLDGWRLEYVHPLHGLALIGLGGIAGYASKAAAGRGAASDWRALLTLAGSLGLVTTTVAIGVRNGSFAAAATSLSLNPTFLTAASGSDAWWGWVSRAGFGTIALATVVPWLAVTLAIAALVRSRDGGAVRSLGLAVVATALLATLAFARLAWLGVADAAAVVLIVALLNFVGDRGLVRWVGVAGALVMVALGTSLLRTEAGSASASLSEGDVIALVERDLSQWLAARTGVPGAVVLAPPSLSTSLFYHGGLRVLGTPYWENKDGMQAAIRLAAASSPDEGQALAGKREVRFIALPSWDDSLDRLVRLTSNAPEKSLLGSLHQWQAPRWLRPLPYPLPAIPGFEGRSVAVFEVVDVQDNAVALSRLAECFVEMGRLEDAGKVAGAIERAFPADLGGRVARANVAAAYGDTDRLTEDMQVLTSAESLGNASTLPWDQQVSYAVALAQGQRLDVARQVAQGCLTDLDEAKLRFLTPQVLYRFQLLCKVSGLEIADAKLRSLARELLPPEIRDKV